ncbi:ATP synthase F1 subunit gamma [Botrimarina hoheduenensis]|uniref:ATP synthase gamma chain n=1 Tax=Botrimarina hoheduenensis TaxID=2528000 RepID=A0A5C5WD54_9BACT|nr:ATP synthase F1 subunit gamma [Botrimarina hoheduenensis]TWT48856.1 ATP synthase gamma chain [Botrimarina hoheduenensis]
MANPRLLDKRRKSVKNIRKITRTMELIATARFKKAMDRASAATAYTNRITQLVADLMQTGLEVSHPLLAKRDNEQNATLLVLTANRGLCGGFNGNVIRAGARQWDALEASVPNCRLEVSGKRGISGMSYRGIAVAEGFTQFEDKPRFDEVEAIATRYLNEFAAGKLDRLDVVYTRFLNAARQQVVVETLLPLGSLGDVEKADSASANTPYEFLPSPESILEEVVPTSFKVKLFKCFLDTAVSEQIARRVAMKGATENADDLIKSLSMQYNRARQGRITNELMDLIGGVNALS